MIRKIQKRQPYMESCYMSVTMFCGYGSVANVNGRRRE